MRTLYGNGLIYPGLPTAREPTSLLVEDGIISWMGQDEDVGGQDEAEWVDLRGAFVTPAFVDAHVHTTSTGLALTGLDLRAVESARDLLDIIDRAARAGRGRPILGSGWDESSWPQPRPPTRAQLDRAAYGGSVYLARVDAHSALTSSALMSAVPGLAGMNGYQDDGWLQREAHDAVRRAAHASLTSSQIHQAQLAALEHAASLGIACVHEMAGPSISSANDLEALLRLGSDGQPLPEVVGYWGELFGIAQARELGAAGAGGDLFCDGSLGSHTAALRSPYSDRPDTSGSLRFDTTDLAEHIVRCARAGLQAGFHAIGDAAVDQVLEAVDVATAQLGRPGGAGHRIEHAEMTADPGRLASSGLLASMQPAFDAVWGGPTGMYADRLGRERASRMNVFSDLVRAGVPLAFGSDSPVTTHAPWAAVRAAAHPHEPRAAISPAAAFAAHTRGGWAASGRAGEGTLTVGAPATFAVWQTAELLEPDARDQAYTPSWPRRSGHARLPDLSPGVGLPVCLRTVRGGVTIYRGRADVADGG
ncbi:MAG: amidohydrolase family protein [Actinomycetota bacterium]|nr:amidohydrolase family protein [Actinomycetota bacterium]